MGSERRGRIVRARDVMQEGISSIDGMATAGEAAAMMRKEKDHALLVEKRHPDDAWGIVTYLDLIQGVIVPGRSAEEVHVYEIMTKPVIPVPAEMDIRYVVRFMHRTGIRRAPVEENGKLVGMVALYSLVLNTDLL